MFHELTSYLSEKFEAIDKRFEGIDQRFERLEKYVSDLPTKSYVSQRLVETEVNITAAIRTVEEKTHRLIEILWADGAITEAHYKELRDRPTF